MFKKKKIIFLLMLFFSPYLLACGRLSEKFSRLDSDSTTVNFSTRAYRGDGIHTQLVLTFGVMIYAENAQDKVRRMSRYIPQSDSPADLILPNGTYNFYVVGYDSAGMAGNMYCGRADNVLLNGTARDVQLVMNSTGICAQDPFAPNITQTTAGVIKDLAGVVCSSSGGDIGLVSPPSFNCDNSSGRPPTGSVTSDVRIKLLEYNALDGRPDPIITLGSIISTCIGAALNGGTPVTISRKVPLGAPFVVKISTFAGASCTGVEYNYTFGRGLMDHNLNTIDFRNGSNTRIYPGLSSTVDRISPSNVVLYLREF